jgi:SAM domain (Sterile alpha motif)
MDVGDRLRSLGLGQYEATFRESEIEADVLLQINAAATFGAQSPHLANMPTAATAITAVASQPRLLSHGLSVNLTHDGIRA